MKPIRCFVWLWPTGWCCTSLHSSLVSPCSQPLFPSPAEHTSLCCSGVGAEHDGRPPEAPRASYMDGVHHDCQLCHLLPGLVALLCQQLPTLGGRHHLASAHRAGYRLTVCLPFSALPLSALSFPILSCPFLTCIFLRLFPASYLPFFYFCSFNFYLVLFFLIYSLFSSFYPYFHLFHTFFLYFPHSLSFLHSHISFGWGF